MNIKSFAKRAITTIVLVPVGAAAVIATGGITLVGGAANVIIAAATGVTDTLTKIKQTAVHSSTVITKQWS